MPGVHTKVTDNPISARQEETVSCRQGTNTEAPSSTAQQSLESPVLWLLAEDVLPLEPVSAELDVGLNPGSYVKPL